MIEVEQLGDVYVLHWHDNENRFNRTFVDAFHAALDEVAAVEGPAAFVTVGEGKFFSNGLDLDWLTTEGADDAGFIDDVHRMLRRVLALDMISVAAINGHAFAGGAMLATAFDYRIMREDRGFWCLPEVDLGLPLTTEMYEGLAAHIPRPALADAALTGRRYSGPEARAVGIVTDVAPEAEVLERAVALATSLAGKNRTVIAAHKRLLYGLG